jgi:protein O-GlcNAc transferase
MVIGIAPVTTEPLGFGAVTKPRLKSGRLAIWLCLLWLMGMTGWAQSPNASIQQLLRSGQRALRADDYASAARDFERARQIAPDNLEANRGLVLSYLQRGQLREAIQLGIDAITRWPHDAELQHWLGLAYFKAGQNESALATLKRSEAIASASFDIHFDVALVLLQQSQYAPAADELERAIKLQPSHALAHVLLGRAYQNTNRTLQGIEQFQTALKIAPATPLGHYHLGFAYASLGRNQEAIAEYRKELDHSPDDPQLAYQFGHCLLETGELKDALSQLKRATELDPMNPDAAYDLGKALLLDGNVEAAIAALQRSVRLKPEDPGCHYQLARALQKAGRTEEAQHEWKRFAELKKAQPEMGGMATGRPQ